MDVPSKRLKLEETSESALNLSLSAGVATKIRREEECDENSAAIQREPNSRSRIFEHRLAEMRRIFQRWVSETYKDSSKTKTITAKKYERIVKTLLGEIKNCAENSKFRFWMKCKGFELVELAQPGDTTRTLLVPDRKGDEIKYKKVAVVENFFDIIYEVHVKEGARGIKHAGQKRTHRTITETYAFLPREAVTKFLLCCCECQKRNNDERRTSSCNSVYPCGYEGISATGPTTIYDKPTTLEPRTIYSCGSALAGDQSRCTCDEIGMLDTTSYEHNAISESFKFSTKIVSPQKTAEASDSREKENRTGTIRKRKRKITRRIVRYSTDNNLERISDCLFDPSICPSTHNHYESAVDERISKLEYPKLKTKDIYRPEQQITNNFVEDTPQFAGNGCTSSKINPAVVDYKETNFAADFKSCPYFAKISEILYNPVKYAIDEDGQNSAASSENLLEKRAVDLLLKARRLEQIKDTITENERRQISLEIYSCRIISFLLNYAADLMLKLTYDY